MTNNRLLAIVCIPFILFNLLMIVFSISRQVFFLSFVFSLQLIGTIIAWAVIYFIGKSSKRAEPTVIDVDKLNRDKWFIRIVLIIFGIALSVPFILN